ncbi:MAG: efflux RND transporter periplasmic adaptor subunit [Bacteroidaceae bacterium]|nr:efflux RND transporter periplasmic adaptor subunit [Bacteroidaceae bacterium]
MRHYNYLPIALLFVAASCTENQSNNQTETAAPVSVTELKLGSISKYINTTGTALPIAETEIKTETAGMYRLQTNPATGKPFKLGDKVKAGQCIIKIEDKEYENSLSVEVKKINLDIAEQELQSQKSLYEKGGVTQKDVRNSEVSVETARQNYETAQIQLERMSITAPFDGVITELPHYTSKARIESGSSMVKIMDYSKMYMEINLPESSINEVKPSQKALITHYTLPYDTIAGNIGELSPAISTETRTFQGKLWIDNSKLLLHPGMFVKADIVVDHADSTIVIPKDVVLSNRNRKFVYIVEKNTAIMRNIKTGLEDNDNIQVLEGLNVNDNLVTRGFETLRDQSKVKVQK